MTTALYVAIFLLLLLIVGLIVDNIKTYRLRKKLEVDNRRATLERMIFK